MSGKLDDPQWRRERAARGGRATAAATAKLRQQIKIDAAVKTLADAAPEMTPETASRVRAALLPVLTAEQSLPQAS